MYLSIHLSKSEVRICTPVYAISNNVSSALHMIHSLSRVSNSHQQIHNLFQFLFGCKLPTY